MTATAKKPAMFLAACFKCSTLKLAHCSCTKCGEARNLPGTFREAAR